MVSSCFPPSIGGIERCVFELSTRLIAAGHLVTVITSSRGLQPRACSSRLVQVGRVIRYPERITVLEVPFVPQIPAKLLLDGKFDLVHIHGMTPTQTDLALIFSRLRAMNVVYTHHFDPQTLGGRLTALYSHWGKLPLGFASVLTCSSSSYANSSVFLKPYLNKVRIIPMGVDPTRFEAKENQHSLKFSRQLQSFDSKVLYVGKLIYYKGLDHLLLAMSRLKTKKACLIIVGSGGERERLGSLAEKLRISDRVFFLGNVPDQQLPSVYAMADVVTLPSVGRRESFGIVLLEAMASGKPVVASAIPGPSDIIGHGRTGYLVTPGDTTALACALDDLLDNAEHAIRMGEEGRLTVKSRYSWQRIFSLFLDAYGSA